MTAPAFGSLELPYKKIAFCFAIPTIVFLGALYSVRSLLEVVLEILGLNSQSSPVGHVSLHLLPPLPEFEASAFKHSRRVVDMDWYRRRDVDSRIHHR